MMTQAGQLGCVSSGDWDAVAETDLGGSREQIILGLFLSCTPGCSCEEEPLGDQGRYCCFTQTCLPGFVRVAKAAP